MFRQEVPSTESPKLVASGDDEMSYDDKIVKHLARVDATIRYAEKCIDRDRKLYLFTWSPDPKRLPDCDFDNQHKYIVSPIITLMRSVYSGCACVETTQDGNPHYHGWYQCSDDPILEKYRIVTIKVLKKMGNLLINKKVRYYKIHKWYKKGNALHYYKYDAANAQLFTPYNPITCDTPEPKIVTNDYSLFFTIEGKKTARKILEVTSQIKDLENFYKKSLTTIV